MKLFNYLNLEKMKLYKFDSEKLQYTPYPYVRNFYWGLKLFGFVILSVLFLGVSISPIQRVYTYKTEDIYLVMDPGEFRENVLVEEIDRLNLPFPHITLAQAKLESGNYSSRIFKESHNLFGMREAKVRINLAVGTQYAHAYYRNWRESLLDYAFWSATYAYKCKTEKQFYQLLEAQYAEAPNYVESLKRIIEEERLEELF